MKTIPNVRIFSILKQRQLIRWSPGSEVAPAGSYDVRSDYFQVRIDVEANGIKLSQFTLLERNGEGATRVVYRSRDTL